MLKKEKGQENKKKPLTWWAFVPFVIVALVLAVIFFRGSNSSTSTNNGGNNQGTIDLSKASVVSSAPITCNFQYTRSITPTDGYYNCVGTLTIDFGNSFPQGTQFILSSKNDPIINGETSFFKTSDTSQAKVDFYYSEQSFEVDGTSQKAPCPTSQLKGFYLQVIGGVYNAVIGDKNFDTQVPVVCN